MNSRTQKRPTMPQANHKIDLRVGHAYPPFGHNISGPWGKTKLISFEEAAVIINKGAKNYCPNRQKTVREW